jgi:methyl-accepting chemotaxis protein
VKMPLIAGGAALAGLAGAAVIAATSRSGRRKKVLGVKLPKQSGLSLPISLPNRNGFKGDAQKIASAVTDAAKRADNFGQSVSKVATSVQNVSETAEQAVKKA